MFCAVRESIPEPKLLTGPYYASTGAITPRYTGNPRVLTSFSCGNSFPTHLRSQVTAMMKSVETLGGLGDRVIYCDRTSRF